VNGVAAVLVSLDMAEGGAYLDRELLAGIDGHRRRHPNIRHMITLSTPISFDQPSRVAL
jgi:hypothetical protein